MVSVLDLRKEALVEKNPDTISSMTSLAVLFWDQGRFSEAEYLESWVVETRQCVPGPKNPDTIASMKNLAYTW